MVVFLACRLEMLQVWLGGFHKIPTLRINYASTGYPKSKSEHIIQWRKTSRKYKDIPPHHRY